jgi:acyl-coenzyme A thioesterase PaaI-like protein
VKPYDPAADGWRLMPAAALPGGLGIPWAKRVGEQWRYGLPIGDGHLNPNGVVHGGVLMAFADHGLGLLAWEAAGRATCITIQLNAHFLDAIRPGEFIELRGEVTRRTSGLVFLRGLAGARNSHGARDVGSLDGVWRVMRPR